jgi:hypothetical protein
MPNAGIILRRGRKVCTVLKALRKEQSQHSGGLLAVRKDWASGIEHMLFQSLKLIGTEKRHPAALGACGIGCSGCK